MFSRTSSTATARRPLAAAGGIILGMVLAALVAPPPPARADGAREYAIKAAFLYNFVKFVDWPPQALPPNSSTLTVGVLGANPFGAALTNLNGKSVKGKTLVVKQFASAPDSGACQVLFIPASEGERERQVLESLKTSSILTVGETKGFAARNGGVINFVVQDDRLRFEINPANAERAKLSISSELLKLARIVK